MSRASLHGEFTSIPIHSPAASAAIPAGPPGQLLAVVQRKGWTWSATKKKWLPDSGSDTPQPDFEGGTDGARFVTSEPMTSDISQAYNVKSACALQALIGAGLSPFGSRTAAGLHALFWSEERYAEYRDYDIGWEALYADLGLRRVDNPCKTVADLPPGKYIVEVAGHMMAVTAGKSGVTLHQDPGNGPGQEKNVILTTYEIR